MSRNEEKSERSNYSTERLQLKEMGPRSMASILISHMEAIPNKAIMLIGEPGIGKTAIVDQLQNTGKFHVFTSRLANEDEGTMIGYADPGTTKDTVYLRVVSRVKEAVETAKKSKVRLVVFFDEINRAKEHMIKCVFNIMDTKRWGDLKLPEDTSFIAAINPPTANHKVRDVLSDSALRRRFVLYAVKADVGEYLQYASKCNIHKCVLEFLQSQPDNIYDYHSFDNGMSYACPASWDAVSKVLYWYEKCQDGKLGNVLSHPSLNNMLTGIMGGGMTHQLLEYIEDTQKLFTPENILTQYGRLRGQVQNILQSEFTVKDLDLDASKLTRAANSLGLYVAHQMVENDMQFHCTESEAYERKITTKERVKINLQGSNIAKFLFDCPSTVMNTFFTSLNGGLAKLVKNSGLMNDYLTRVTQLTAYSEYVEAADKYNNITQQINQ